MSPRQVGEKAARTRTVRERDIELFPVRPSDEITAEVEVEGPETREDKPPRKLRARITNQDGEIELDGSALVWTEGL